MKKIKYLACLLAALIALSGVTALADAAVDDFWAYAYEVDRTVYVNASDGLGLFMRYGPGTEYGKVNANTVPMYAALHVTKECGDQQGRKWGFCEYTFPGQSWQDAGWVCLVETTAKNPAPAQAAQEKAVDKVLYVNAKDGLGLFMRTGPDTSCTKVNADTIPMYTPLHITRECTDGNGRSWGYCSYQFPGKGSADSGWVCLVETTSSNLAPAQAEVQQPEQAEPLPAETDDAAAAELIETVESDPARTADDSGGDSQPVTVVVPAQDNSVTVLALGILIGVVALTAVLLLVRMAGKKRQD